MRLHHAHLKQIVLYFDGYMSILYTPSTYGELGGILCRASLSNKKRVRNWSVWRLRGTAARGRPKKDKKRKMLAILIFRKSVGSGSTI